MVATGARQRKRRGPLRRLVARAEVCRPPHLAVAGRATTIQVRRRGPMEFSVGNAIGTSFRVWFRNFVPFTLLSVIVHLPLIILWFVLLDDLPSDPDQIVRLFLIAGALGFILNGLLVATVTYGVVMELRGTRASLGACIGVGLSRFFPALGVTILFYLGFLAGLIALIVPGVILACMWFVAVPASVIERPGIGGAFRRSSQLTDGVRGQIFGVLLLVWGGNVVVSKILQSKYDGPYTSIQDLMSQLKTYAILDTVAGILFSTLAAVVAAVVYAQLRHSKDGTTADELARVFD
jgi:hypothetical protein